MTEVRIVVLGGDGIGPEVADAATEVLRTALHQVAQTDLVAVQALMGGVAIDACGDPLPADTLALCRSAPAVFLGAVGGPDWEHLEGPQRPEAGLLRIRKELGLWANLRPVRPHAALTAASPLRPELLDGVDLLFLRELTSGIYFGRKQEGLERASDECAYTRQEVERAVRRAFELAQSRKKRLTSVDKANVMATSRLWRAVATEVAPDYPDVELEHELVDAMAMKLMLQPSHYDVVVTENLFGDVLTDEASVLAASLGMLPSASLGDGGFGLYEPVHGSAPDIAGRGIANPIGAIESMALMARHSLQLPDVADAIQLAVHAVLTAGTRTGDIGGKATTADVTEAVCEALRR